MLHLDARGLAHTRRTVRVGGMRSSLMAWRPCPAPGWCVVCPQEAGWAGAGGGGSQAGEGELEAQGSALFRPARVPPARPGTSVLPHAPRCRLAVPPPISQWLPPPHLSGSGQLAGGLFSFASAAKRLLCLTVQLQPTSFSRWEAGPFLGGCGELSGDEGC